MARIKTAYVVVGYCGVQSCGHSGQKSKVETVLRNSNMDRILIRAL